MQAARTLTRNFADMARCLGLSHRAKLKIFDRVRLLYHVAQAGWSAALESYADPSATLLLDSPAARRVPATCNPSPERPSETEPRSDRDITKSQRAARAGSPKKNKNEDPESELLPPHFKEPEDCQPLLHHLEATDGVDLCDETLPGSTTTNASAIILLMSFLTAYGLSWCALDDQLRLIDTLFGSKENMLPNSKTQPPTPDQWALTPPQQQQLPWIPASSPLLQRPPTPDIAYNSCTA
ncbi:hypothetical protein IscW_ISCW003691 [Ixodes scapularis]|uniref:Uncharacterized protein n=1 Tax=Ixodes scapularis TaxID=6945 RepID=B7PI48_IXOSC|nr:hypothetical protein IscW_ISCW003691 [Ixodes scapularis]|eukprot:XP_002404379.1 hypothetical protein IscW_ISCW003691 [Ixodes scapularis]